MNNTEILNVINQMPLNSQRFLKIHGNRYMTDFVIKRSPIKQAVNVLLNIISFGKFEKIKQKLNYDKLYHIRLIYKLDNDKVYQMEKTSNVQLGRQDSNYKTDDIFIINIDKKIKLIDFVTNTIRYMGGDKFINYRSFFNNCQNYLKSAIIANDMYSEEAINFIYQPMQKMIMLLPIYVQNILNTITDIGSKLDLLLQNLGWIGLGFKQKMKKKRLKKK